MSNNAPITFLIGLTIFMAMAVGKEESDQYDNLNLNHPVLTYDNWQLGLHQACI